MDRPHDPGAAVDHGDGDHSAAAPAVTQACLPTRAYFDDAVFAREIERLFRGGWQFVGLTTELAENNQFVTLDLPGQALLVQNFKGELKAFQNVCTHRFNRLHDAERGRSALRCGYHAWTFDASGFPVGRPKNHQFPAETAEQRAALCLPNYRLETCGSFVFVDTTGAAPPLRDHLGGYWNLLETLSGHMGAEVGFSTIPHRANWKLLVENVLECYHCSVVHPETFVRGLGIGQRSLEQVVFESGHSSCHFPRTEIRREHLRRKILSHLEKRDYAHDSFQHIHIFPNLFISSQEGLTFYVGQAVPVSPRETLLRTRIFEPRVELSEGGRARQDQLNAQSLEIAAAVIGEDRAVLENVQRGVEVSERSGIIGAEEIRIARFIDHYNAAMS